MTDGNKNQLLTVNQFCSRHKWARIGGIRSALFHRESNGLESCGAVVRFGRKILLDESLFIQWMRERDGERVNVQDDENLADLSEAMRELEAVGFSRQKASAILVAFARGLRDGANVGPEVARERLRNISEGAPITAPTITN